VLGSDRQFMIEMVDTFGVAHCQISLVDVRLEGYPTRAVTHNII